jgi:hypothetical protein
MHYHENISFHLFHFISYILALLKLPHLILKCSEVVIFDLFHCQTYFLHHTNIIYVLMSGRFSFLAVAVEMISLATRVEPICMAWEYGPSLNGTSPPGVLPKNEMGGAGLSVGVTSWGGRTGAHGDGTGLATLATGFTRAVHAVLGSRTRDGCST